MNSQKTFSYVLEWHFPASTSKSKQKPPWKKSIIFLQKEVLPAFWDDCWSISKIKNLLYSKVTAKQGVNMRLSVEWMRMTVDLICLANLLKPTEIKKFTLIFTKRNFLYLPTEVFLACRGRFSYRRLHKQLPACR